MEEEGKFLPELTPYILRRRSTQPTSLMQIELKNRIQNLLDSPFFDISVLRSTMNSSNISTDPTPASSGSYKSSADPIPDYSRSYSAYFDEDLTPTPRTRKKSSTNENILPQFLTGAAVPNSIVRSRNTSLESSDDENSDQKKGVSDVSILDKIFRRLLPPTGEDYDDIELHMKIEKELEKRKLLAKYVRRAKILKEEPAKKIDPEKEKRRHKQRITPDKLVDWEGNHNFESVQKSIQVSRSLSKTLITEDELLKQQSVKASSEPIPVKLTNITTSVGKIKPNTQVASAIQKNQDVQVSDMSVNEDAKVDTSEADVETESVQEPTLIPERSKSLAKELDIYEVSWQDMLKDLSELQPLKRMSLLDLEAMTKSYNADEQSQNIQEAGKVMKQRRKSRSNSSQKRKSSDRSAIQLVKGSETLSKTSSRKSSKVETSEYILLSERTIDSSSDDTTVTLKMQKSSDIQNKLKRPRRRSKQKRKSDDSSIMKKSKIQTSQDILQKSDIGSSELEEKFRATEIPLPSEIILADSSSLLEKPESSVSTVKLEKDIKQESDVSKKQHRRRKKRKSSAKPSVKEEIPQTKVVGTEKETDENINITEESLLQDIMLLETERRKLESDMNQTREHIHAEIEAITQKTKVLLAKRRQSQTQNPTLKSKVKVTKIKPGIKIKALDIQTKFYSQQPNKKRKSSLEKQYNLTNRRKISVQA